MRGSVSLYGAVLLAGVATAVRAQTSSVSAGEQVFEDWRVSCITEQSPPQCQMVQAAGAQAGSAAPFLLSVSGSYGVITVPVGVYLANGIEILVDERRPFRVLFEVCDQRGCYAGFRLDGAVLEAFKAGRSARFRVWTGKTEAVEFPVSLKGFTAGWKALEGSGVE